MKQKNLESLFNLPAAPDRRVRDHHGMLALLRNREQWEKQCANPGLLNPAGEELLRFDPPAQHPVPGPGH